MMACMYTVSSWVCCTVRVLGKAPPMILSLSQVMSKQVAEFNKFGNVVLTRTLCVGLGMRRNCIYLLVIFNPSGLCPDHHSAQWIDAWRHGWPETLENTMFLVVEGLEHHRTCVLEGSRMAVDGWRDGRLLKTWENMMFLMTEGLEHCKTHVLEGPAWPSVVGAQQVWQHHKTTIWHRYMRFYWGFKCFYEKLVGAGPKRIDFTLSVLEDISQRKFIFLLFFNLQPTTSASDISRRLVPPKESFARFQLAAIVDFIDFFDFLRFS